ncbi:hypothetical protein ASG37_16520 [Sphingomonas sp. Leaf407]|uniref:hypothetical protein n=1 Tax=unclassified Sphingomonas TaxID=196159 RepID=UPI0007002477|nr:MULTISPECIES: hypothetical protein [unclassified Sphingomonas]KQN33754.1 hypothetical protein ASE97_16510 [Sphingomonas sp. Leaf42]KQT25035.1 hypothetical protein ASG37_16520 [Sphingomonas sp. Leaf407]
MTEPAPSRNQAGLLASNAAWNLARYVINWLVLLAVPPFLIHRLPRDVYATWILLLQIATYYAMIDINLQTAVSRFVAQAVANGCDALRMTLSSIVALLGGLAVVVLVCGILAATFLDRIFPAIPVWLLPDARIAALLIVGALFVTLPFTALVGAFLGFQRNRTITIAIVVSKLASGVAMIVAVRLGGSLISLAVCFAVTTLLAPIVYVLSWRRAEERVPLSAKSVERRTIREFLSYSTSIGLIALSSMLVSGFALPIMSIFDFSGVTAYSLALVYGNMLLIPQAAILTVVLPMLSRQSMAADAAGMGRALLRFARLSGMSLVAFTAGLLVAGPPFLRLWIGTDLGAQVLPSAILLVLAQFVALSTHPYRIAVLSVGQQIRTVPTLLFEGVWSIALALVLVRQWGGTGVAAATLLGALAGLFAQLFYSMPRTDAIVASRRGYARAAFALPLVSILPALAVLGLTWERDISLPVWVILIALGVAPSVGIAWLINLDTADRRMIWDMIVARLPYLRNRRARHNADG